MIEELTREDKRELLEIAICVMRSKMVVAYNSASTEVERIVSNQIINIADELLDIARYTDEEKEAMYQQAGEAYDDFRFEALVGSDEE